MYRLLLHEYQGTEIFQSSFGRDSLSRDLRGILVTVTLLPPQFVRFRNTDVLDRGTVWGPSSRDH